MPPVPVSSVAAGRGQMNPSGQGAGQVRSLLHCLIFFPTRLSLHHRPSLSSFTISSFFPSRPTPSFHHASSFPLPTHPTAPQPSTAVTAPSAGTQAANQGAPSQQGAAQQAQGQGENIKFNADKLAERSLESLKQLQAACSAWFTKVNGGLQEPYPYERAKADQEKIILLLNTLAQDLRKSGLENLFVDQKMTTATGEEVKLPKMPRSVLAKEADATSAKMIDELKELTTKLGKEIMLSSTPGIVLSDCMESYLAWQSERYKNVTFGLTVGRTRRPFLPWRVRSGSELARQAWHGASDAMAAGSGSTAICKSTGKDSGSPARDPGGAAWQPGTPGPCYRRPDMR
eukprot:747615-Hanusia_phi.AAC.1